VLRIATPKLTAHLRVVAGPEALEVLGDLYRAPVGSEEPDLQAQPPAGEVGGLSEAEEVLEA
jgi:hypothetical protein